MTQHHRPEVVPTQDKQQAKQNGELSYDDYGAQALVEMNDARPGSGGENRDSGRERGSEPGRYQRFDRLKNDSPKDEFFEKSAHDPCDYDPDKQFDS
jgi:hypothetical protein